MNKKNIFKLCLLILIFVSLFQLVCANDPDDIDVQGGHSYYADIRGLSPTDHWTGIMITDSGQSLSESNEYFMSLITLSPVIQEIGFPGSNLNDDEHYYAAMLSNDFNLYNVSNVTAGDLDAWGLFDDIQFPTFYPGYMSWNDNPNATFCCDTDIITISDTNFTAYKITLTTDVEYYVVKYNTSIGYTPLFIVPLRDSTCYEGSPCLGEFVLPVNSEPYYFYALSEHQRFDYNVWIDGLESTTFVQTALPYVLTVEVQDIDTEEIVPDVPVIIGEEGGHNFFIPLDLSGTLSTAYSVGITNSSGRETFAVAPTGYYEYDDYNIFLAVLVDNMTTSRLNLNVTSMATTVQQPVTISPSRLDGFLTGAVNEMRPLGENLFEWTNSNIARSHSIIYDVGTQTFTSSTLYTGIPNVITITLAGGGIPSDYEFRIREEDGYLVFNANTDNESIPALGGPPPLDPKSRFHDGFVDANFEFVVVPTYYMSVKSTIIIDLVDGDRNIISSVELPIISDTNLELTGISYNNGELKQFGNELNVVLYSLFYSLNS